MVAMPTRTIFRSACPLDKRADAIPLATTAKLMRKSRRFTDSHYPRESDYPLKPSTIFRASLPSRRCSKMGRTMSESGQTEKNSVRAHVFRFALELGHCSTQLACLKRAKERTRSRGRALAGRSGVLRL